MSEYIPDKWVVVKIGDTDLYKVFACWYGGYAGSDSWKLNSGIASVVKEGYCFDFTGYSGSVYSCHSDTYGTNMYGMGILNNFIENAAKNGVTITVMPEDTDFLTLNYGE